ncbi:MAG TPA: hypothetical protein VJ972_01895 [Anaerolineales bacterium]|nr:hypothetical protein [Anaerolineales bacterium]
MKSINNNESLDWAFWFYWIIATTIGWMIGEMFFIGLPVVMSGAAISSLQWAVLNNRINQAWRWAIFSLLGWVIGYILFLFFFPKNMFLLAGPLMGIAVGIPQWNILRKEVNFATWWIIISIIAWTTGISLIPGLLSSGALPGALTGLTLVILFRFSSPRTA